LSDGRARLVENRFLFCLRNTKMPFIYTTMQTRSQEAHNNTDKITRSTQSFIIVKIKKWGGGGKTVI